MKLRLKLFIVFCVFIVVCTFIIIMQKELYPDANYNSDKIQKISIIINSPLSKIEYYTNKFDIKSESGIETVIFCIGKMKEYEKETINAEIAPIQYTFVYTFKSGSIKSIKHFLKPSTTISPLFGLFRLDEVIRQLNPIFHVKITDISKASVNYAPNDSVSIKKYIANAESINFLLDIAKENLLLNEKNIDKSNCGITFLSNNNDDILCSFDLNATTYKLDEMRKKIPEINEVVTIAEKNQFQ